MSSLTLTDSSGTYSQQHQRSLFNSADTRFACQLHLMRWGRKPKVEQSTDESTEILWEEAVTQVYALHAQMLLLTMT
eukprot:12072409-Karenia_brevis.AAC.1